MRRFFGKRRNLAVSLVFFVFAVMAAAMITASLFVALLDAFDLVDFGNIVHAGDEITIGPIRIILAMLAFSFLLGVAIAAFFSKKALNPLRRIIDATRKVAHGDFNVSVEAKGIEELEELSDSFNKMTHELSSIETLRSDFINNFSHELKTPIASIRGFAKLLKEGDLTDDEKQEYLGIIISESERLSNLSTSVLNLSKYESMEIVTEKAPFCVDEQIRRVVVMTEAKWSEKNLDINIDMEEVYLSGNADLLQQVWINLLDNALKFTDLNGRIEIKLTDSGGFVVFVIRDNGRGVSKEATPHIFDKFYQEDDSHNQKGNGLGLSIVKRIVELHGGTVEVESNLNSGSTFTVILPK